MATAHAKARMSKTVDLQDAEEAVELVQYAYFKKVRVQLLDGDGSFRINPNPLYLLAGVGSSAEGSVCRLCSVASPCPRPCSTSGSQP